MAEVPESIASDTGSNDPSVFRGTLLFGILVVALLFRLFGLTDQCLTNDEVIEVEDAIHSTWSEVLWCPDAFPPAYRVALGVWENVFGEGTTTRWLSLLFGLAFLPAVAYATQLVTESRSAALWAGFVAAVNPLMIHYSQETRAYMMYLCAAAWILVFFIRSLKFNRRTDWIVLALLSAAGCYVHYYMGLWLVCLALVWLGSVMRRRELLSDGLLAFVLACVGIVPLLSFFMPDYYDTVGYPVKSPVNIMAVGYTYYSFMAGFCLGPSRAELHELGAEGLLRQFVPWLAVFGILVLYSVCHAIRPLWRRPAWFWMLLLCSTLPVAVAAGLSSVTDLRFGVRYVVICVVPILCVLGVGISTISNQAVRWFVAGAFLTLAIIATYVRHNVSRYKNEDLRSVAEVLSEHDAGTVFILADYNKRPLGHYVGNQDGFIPLPVPEKTAEQIDDRAELTEVLTRIGSANESRPIWIVLCRAFHGDPHYLFRNWLNESSCVELTAEFEGAKLYRYRGKTSP